MFKYIKIIQALIGPLLFILTLYSPLALSLDAKLVLATTLLMCALWITGVLNVYVTALLPLVIFPFANSQALLDSLREYADRIIFLFLGGFMLAIAIEKSMLHKRFALTILKIFGTKPKHVVGAFMIATGSLSAWISNTATTMLMLPVALVVIAQVNVKDRDRFATCLLLAVAYSASLGGLATLIGTPPNAIFASLARELVTVEVSFGKWLLIGMPLSIVSLIVVWLYMVNFAVRISNEHILGEKAVIINELKGLARMKRDEKLVAIIFCLTAAAWITRGLVWGRFLPFIDDSIIALIAAISLFIIKSEKGRLLEWDDAKKVPWGVLLLMGGGLASGFIATGLDKWIANQ